MARIYSKWVLKCLCVIIVVVINFPYAAQIKNFSKFSNYKLIQPRFYHGREKREIVTTKQEDGNHAEHLIMTYNDEDKNYIVDLTLNKHLITDGYSMKYQKNGKYVFRNNSIQNMELCYYQGKIRNLPDSWAALSTCSEDGLGGIIYNGYEIHYFEKAFDEKGEHLRSSNFLYKHSDLIGTRRNKSSKEQTRKRKYKRSYQQSRLVKGPYNSNRRSRYIELLVVVDHEWFLAQNSKLILVELNVLNMVNTLNALYTPLNIYITITDILVWTERTELEVGTNVYETLLKFLIYREEQLIVQHPNDFSVLLMFDQQAENLKLFGFSFAQKMCTSTSSGCVVIAGNNLVTAVRVARRIAHSLGIKYDTDYCISPEENNCIMNKNIFDFATHWSSCSFDHLVRSYERGLDYCLRNKPDDQTKYNDPTCGNGFVDSGEQCDCGLPQLCNNSCCNAATCTMCWWKGSCRTRSDQCQILWGGIRKPASDECYSLNTQGSLRGSCGYDKLNKTYTKCSSENILCGMVHCRSPDETLKIGSRFGPYELCRSINTENGREQCCTAKIDFGYNEIDPGLVPDGSTCGESKMCVNQTCMEISDLRTAINTCPNNCSGNGTCNNLGHCHCNFGLAPPLCKNHGYGGSEDSGPTIDLSSAMISNRPFNFILKAGKEWYDSTKIIASHAVP